ncbi:MAG: alpha/beta fold hydrolase [Bacteroidetes bacterium]|nr:alpha/beta fold hydrolase [Bacteroidota bacterium]
MILANRTYGEKGETLVILHGLFGQSDNWTGIARKLSESLKVITLDLRNHGDSPHSEDFTYELMANDVVDTCKAMNIGNIHLAGHSMGGKVAMVVAQKFPELLRSLVVIDIAPKFYNPHHQQILKGLNALKPSEIQGRQDAEEELSAYIQDAGVRQFLLKNLKRKDTDGFEWKFNLKVLTDKIENVGKSTKDAISVVAALFFYGEKSSYLKDSDKTEIQALFPNSEFRMMEGAGHWLHAENPTEMIAVLKDWVNRNS